MTAPQCTLEPPSPTSDLVFSSTPGTTRSKFRSLFGWRKSSNGSQRPRPRADDEQTLQVPSVGDVNVRPKYSTRSRSEPARHVAPGRSHALRYPPSRKHDKIVVDPPPLAQVHGQSLLHATLKAPLSYWGKPKSRRPSSSIAEAAPRDVMGDIVEVKRSHRKTDSGQSCCSTKEKLFFLVNGPYVLQYDGDSEGNALPEKIFVLDKDSMAGICDTVPGRPWVLQISRMSSGAAKTQAQPLRPSWSRLTLRQPEDKRIVNTLLLVFDDSEDLYTWLHTIRKEVEHLGGMECGQDSDEDDQSWRADLTKKFASGAEGESDSNETCTSRTLSPVTAPLTLNIAAYPTEFSKNRPQSGKSAASSNKTSSSLDRLRDSATSYSYASTLATSSGCGSAPSTSPICEHFPSIKTVTGHTTSDLYLRSYSPKRGTAQSPSSSSTPGRGILERRKLSVGSLQLAPSNEPRARKNPPTLSSVVSASPVEGAMPAANLRSGSVMQTNPGLSNNSTPSIFSQHAASTGDSQQPGSEHKALSRQVSLVESTGGPTKAKYSLFPVGSPPESKSDVQAKSVVSLSPGPASPELNTPLPRLVTSAPKHRKGRSRTVTLELRQHRKSTLLAAGEFDLPQRSPAVTDDMITFNFGITRNDPPASPMPDIKVPRLVDLNLDLDFLRNPYRQPLKKQSPASVTRQVSASRSISSLHNTKAPAGPPPTRPLPAVPSGSQHLPQTQRSSQYSQHSQHSRYSQASSGTHDSRMNIDIDQPQNVPKDAILNMEPPSYDSNMREPRQAHRRILSGSPDGPPAPTRLSSRHRSGSGKSTFRSHGPGQRKSNKQQD
ncbi:hypothetical protein PMZ80_003393 [Knufia obscura]|uniref:PH domain-containing protein n=1 Tax=Knufia obscura TaxID=1635080 RepID=A0ABR0RU33_9EURO|nr:hypothetical protein PMZ80_003393 [Knufia obscura]